MFDRMWYATPASEWKEGLPFGNGTLGGMQFGSPQRERIGLNHEWLYKGLYRDRDTEKIERDKLASLRRLLYDGKYEEGTVLANNLVCKTGGVSGKRQRVDPYQPAGDLYIAEHAQDISGYTRELDLSRAVVCVGFVGDGLRRTREMFAHKEKNVICVRLMACGRTFGADLYFDRIDDGDCTLTKQYGDGCFSLTGSFETGVVFTNRCDIKTDGNAEYADAAVKITDATFIEAYVTIDVSICDASSYIPDASDTFDALMAEHSKTFAADYKAVELSLNAKEPVCPTDERIEDFRNGKQDPALPALYFNFGRYLLISSSGNLPAQLQGIWNDRLDPPWDCDFHTDINIQMNYWAAETTGLGKYTDSFFNLWERFIPHGQKAASDIYGCRGICLPIQTDAWGRATPESNGWACWIGAAPWLAQHFWWHYEFTLDRDFLRKRAYPFFKLVARFYEDYLEPDETGTLQICPSQSPENRFDGSGDMPVSLCVSSAMDVTLCRMALEYAIFSSEILGTDEIDRIKWMEMRIKLPQLKTGSKGQLLEWNQEFVECEPGHRHLSHLIGVYPGDTITPEKEPVLFEAALRSLELRLSHGGGHTGWSRSWTACLFARFGKAEEAWEHLHELISEFATGTLLDLHPPRIFQIDGNFGGAAAVTEMLIQSYHGIINILPALPAAWPDGEITGLRARGCIKADIKWSGGKPEEASFTCEKDGVCRIYAGCVAGMKLVCDGVHIESNLTNGIISFNMQQNKLYRFIKG